MNTEKIEQLSTKCNSLIKFKNLLTDYQDIQLKCDNGAMFGELGIETTGNLAVGIVNLIDCQVSGLQKEIIELAK